ncbi:biogenesis of lysosome-related organelles complex 1 subunit 6-like [Zophobas morio]|uniref:biogenesis of lysosome-related organelles complex 1 subunit 6-like n=1 Tax=Zophobas morio TaxID=2755281 RepID=UPI003082E349
MLVEEKDENIPSELQRNPYTETVTPLTNGLLKTYGPSLTQVKNALSELTEKESTLLEQVHSENLALAESQHSDDLHTMFAKIETYQTKLVNIKKEMKHLHDKSVKLKKRALKLQQFREKQDYIKQQKEANIKQEEDLIVKK